MSRNRGPSLVRVTQKDPVGHAHCQWYQQFPEETQKHSVEFDQIQCPIAENFNTFPPHLIQNQVIKCYGKDSSTLSTDQKLSTDRHLVHLTCWLAHSCPREHLYGNISTCHQTNLSCQPQLRMTSIPNITARVCQRRSRDLTAERANTVCF